MDKPHGSGLFVVRPWFLSMGIIESAIIVLLLLSYLLQRLCLHRNSALQCFIYFLLVVGGIKTLIWAIAELYLFGYSIAHYCSGGVFAYGIILTIIHGIMLFMLFCCSRRWCLFVYFTLIPILHQLWYNLSFRRHLKRCFIFKKLIYGCIIHPININYSFFDMYEWLI